MKPEKSFPDLETGNSTLHCKCVLLGNSLFLRVSAPVVLVEIVEHVVQDQVVAVFVLGLREGRVRVNLSLVSFATMLLVP